jgi:SNF2 family DNA or RNA helicase
MIIDIQSDIIILKNIDENLKPYQLNQLRFWGFSNNQAFNGSISSSKIEKLLPKIIEYFQNEKISFALSEEGDKYYQGLLIKESKFSNLILSAKSFKEGKYDQEAFSEHLRFLENNIIRKLKDHQIKASFHLWLVKNGANFSVPGSGKTTVVLTIYERLRLEGKVNTLFVVGPPACFGPWRDEFEIVLGRKPKNFILAGGKKLDRLMEYYKSEDICELYLTTFQTLLNDQNEVSSFFSNKEIRPFVVVDEAHYIKQINGNWANAVLKISQNANYKCILTGTPIPQSYTDLFNLFDFLLLDYNTLTPEVKARLKECEENNNQDEAKSILENKIGPLFYRVRKSELNLKPQIFYDPIKISMNPNEQKVYDAIYKKIRNYAKDDYFKNIDLISKLRRGRMIRLRQSISYTKLLNTAVEDYSEEIIPDNSDLRYLIAEYDKIETPAKMEYLLELVKGFQRKREKVVIWSNFLGTIELMTSKFNESNIYCKKIIGETPIERATISDEETREKIRNEFVDKNSGLDVLIANPAACAESISLHKTCFNAVYYDLSYNCAQYLQSLDRIHRVGGSENQSAYYYYLQYQDTIDKEILETINRKSEKMFQVIENDYNIYSLDMFDGRDELEAYERLFL